MVSVGSNHYALTQPALFRQSRPTAARSELTTAVPSSPAAGPDHVSWRALYPLPRVHCHLSQDVLSPRFHPYAAMPPTLHHAPHQSATAAREAIATRERTARKAKLVLHWGNEIQFSPEIIKKYAPHLFTLLRWGMYRSVTNTQAQ